VEPPAVQVTASSETGTAAATVEVRKTSGSDRHGSKRKLRFETSDDQGSKKLRKRSKIAKGEISSLALRELKLLKIDKTYGMYFPSSLISIC
jgi:PHD and RING finger domain-containing protein 1